MKRRSEENIIEPLTSLNSKLSTLNYLEISKWGEKELIRSDVDNAERESFWLLQAAFKSAIRPALAGQSAILSQAQFHQYQRQITQRSQGIPLAYLLESQEFMGLDFFVNQDVLIPRPETEILVRTALEEINQSSSLLSVLDIGTGSGCIAVSIATWAPSARVTAVDISEKALQAAKKNAEIHGVSNKINFYNVDLFCDVDLKSKNQELKTLDPALREHWTSYAFDLIISNPPYIRTGDLPHLQKEIQFEPGIALDGGETGFAVIERLVRQSPRYLNPGGSLMLEVGYDQADTVKSLMQNCGFTTIKTVYDEQGIQRVLAAKLSKL